MSLPSPVPSFSSLLFAFMSRRCFFFTFLDSRVTLSLDFYDCVDSFQHDSWSGWFHHPEVSPFHPDPSRPEVSMWSLCSVDPFLKTTMWTFNPFSINFSGRYCPIPESLIFSLIDDPEFTSCWFEFLGSWSSKPPQLSSPDPVWSYSFIFTFVSGKNFGSSSLLSGPSDFSVQICLFDHGPTFQSPFKLTTFTFPCSGFLVQGPFNSMSLFFGLLLSQGPNVGFPFQGLKVLNLITFETNLNISSFKFPHT